MAETLNKRIQAQLTAERRENARRYWAQKEILSREAASPAIGQSLAREEPSPSLTAAPASPAEGGSSSRTMSSDAPRFAAATGAQRKSEGGE